MIVRVQSQFFELDRLVSAKPDGGAMELTLASPGDNVTVILYNMSPDEFDDLLNTGTDIDHYRRDNGFSSPAQWANRGRAGSEGSMLPHSLS